MSFALQFVLAKKLGLLSWPRDKDDEQDLLPSICLATSDTYQCVVLEESVLLDVRDDYLDHCKPASQYKLFIHPQQYEDEL